MEKVIESTEQVTVFRDEYGDVKGFIINDYQSDGEAHTSYLKISGGYRWLSQHDDKEKVIDETRGHFAYHSHFCPTCRYDVDCEQSYKCDDPNKHELCDECALPGYSSSNDLLKIEINGEPEFIGKVLTSDKPIESKSEGC